VKSDDVSDLHDPKKALDQIFAIAPILPGSGTGSAKEPQTSASGPNASSPKNERKPAPVDNLIDLSSRPSSTAPPEQSDANKNILHPTSDPKQTPAPQLQNNATPAPVGNPPTGNLLDHDDHGHADVNNKMSNLNINHEPMVPQGARPIKRTDTETSETDVFVDAEG
jgi:hypothetical protein